jgi:hypothetical protein
VRPYWPEWLKHADVEALGIAARSDRRVTGVKRADPGRFGPAARSPIIRTDRWIPGCRRQLDGLLDREPRTVEIRLNSTRGDPGAGVIDHDWGLTTPDDVSQPASRHQRPDDWDGSSRDA